MGAGSSRCQQDRDWIWTLGHLCVENTTLALVGQTGERLDIFWTGRCEVLVGSRTRSGQETNGKMTGSDLCLEVDEGCEGCEEDEVSKLNEKVDLLDKGESNQGKCGMRKNGG